MDPDAASWELEVEVPLPDDERLPVHITAELLEVTGAEETVHWSGRIASLTLGAEQVQRIQARQMPVHRGPAANLEVESVAITGAPAEMLQDATAELDAEGEGGSDETRVFWGSLEPSVGSVNSSGVVHAEAGSGTTATVTITATAGGESGSAEITVDIP